MANLKKNCLYSSLLTSANYIFPLLTYPYVSRVLGVTNIGICNFVDSIINYYIMFSMMGIVATAIREVAANRDDKVKLSKSFSCLFVLNTISTMIVLLMLVVSVVLIPNLWEYKELMAIGFFKVLFNYLLIDWLYKGLEDFGYITKYGLITKCLYVIGVFAFVKDADDYSIYYLLSMLMIAMNAFINLSHSRNLVHLRLEGISLHPYLPSFFILGVYIVLTSMYTTFNVAYLGFSCGETEVGYYTTATKLHSIFLALFTAFTGVMMPRMSNLVAEGKIDEFKLLLSKSYHVLFLFSFPIVVFSVVFAPEIIYVIAGKGYDGAVLPMRIVMPLILIIGYEQIGVLQVLMPLKKDKAIFFNSCIGAVVGIAANMFFVGFLQSVGSAIVWTTSEFVVMLLVGLCMKRYLSVKFPIKDFSMSLLYAIPCVITTCLVSSYIEGLTSLVVGALIIALYYSVLYVGILKDSMVRLLLKSIIGKFKMSN